MTHSKVRIAGMLEELGSTADEVAKSLRAEGIRGIRYAVRALNPVVRYAETRLPSPVSMDVIDPEHMRIVFPNHQETQVALPPGVRAFLQAFQRGEYPDLEMAPDEV